LKGPGAHYAAQIRLQNVQQVYNQLTALKFSADSSKMIKVRDQKVALINQLNQELAEIIKYDSGEEIVGSLELLGRANAHMAEAFLTAPIPAEVQKDETAKKQYTAAVAELARPFQGKALESYRSAVSRGRELETYTPAYHAAIEAIGQLEPSRRVDLGEEAMPRNYQDWMGLR
jgi:hypothetical protein